MTLSLSIEIMGISSNPHTRTISSTRSASPMISARHGGTAHSIRSPLPETSKPKVFRILKQSGSGTFTPVKFSIRLYLKVKTFFQSGSAP